ncbi:MAG: DUF3631 domain-containing protein, partial [Gammaproteobacteria bacterium]|nr:DUF3631 domain-containing protein [Gammaproteobacteria bacterium]
LIPKLAELDSSPWSDYNFKQYDEERKIITDKQVAFLLKRYGVTHGTLRIGEGTAKGYTRDAINTAYERYKPKSSVTPSQVNKHADSTRHKPDTDVTDAVLPDTTVTASVTGEMAETMGCDGVTGNSPQEGFIPAKYGKQPEVSDSEIFVK